MAALCHVCIPQPVQRCLRFEQSSAQPPRFRLGRLLAMAGADGGMLLLACALGVVHGHVLRRLFLGRVRGALGRIARVDGAIAFTSQRGDLSG